MAIWIKVLRTTGTFQEKKKPKRLNTYLYNIFIIVLFFTSCQDKNWDTIDSDLKNKGDLIYFINEKIGYVAGVNSEMINPEAEFPQFNDHSYLAITRDGAKTWTDISPKIDGKIYNLQAFENGGVVIVVEETYDQISTLFISENYGHSWRKILHGNISKIYFRNIKEGEILFFDREKKSHYVKFENNQLKDSIVFNDFFYGKFREFLYKINDDYDFKKQTPFISNIQLTNFNKIDRLFQLREKYDYSAVAESEKYLYVLVSNEKNESKILKFDGSMVTEISLGKYSDYGAFDFYVYKETLVLNAYKKDSGSIVGVTKELIFSTDGGENWQLKNMPDNLLARPQFMYEDQFFITGTFGGFQKYYFKR